MKLHFLIGLFLASACAALKFELEAPAQTGSFSERCVTKHATPNSYIRGFAGVSAGHPQLHFSAHIREDETGHAVWTKATLADDDAHFSFRSAPHPSAYTLCVACRREGSDSVPATPIIAHVSFDVGHDLFDLETAHDLRVKPVESEIIGLQGVIAKIAEEYQQLVHRGSLLRNTNESTNNRLTLFFALTVCSLCALIFWQFLYMKRFFKSKKLID